MKNLNQARVVAGVEISELADYIGVSYITLGKIFKGEILCPEELKERIKIFLIKNYTKCIEKL